jgi:curli biogenesis system outer membrane secretion channel CsgG
VAATTQAAAPIRTKPDFGGLTSEHVEASATGPTLEAAIDSAIRLAVEQVNGKTVSGGAAQLSLDSQLAVNGEHIDVHSSTYAQWLATRTSGVVTNFRILSQEQLEHPLSTDEQNLKATQGESWNKGTLDASAQDDASAGVRSGDAKASATLHRQAALSGEWDQHQGAQSVDYQRKHTEYAQEWSVKVAADVAKYREAPSAKLTRVVIALPRSKQATFRVGDNAIAAHEIANQIRTELTDALTQTHRFTMLDRDADEEIGREIELIQSGNAKPAEAARLGQQLATDLIVIPTIERFEYLRHQRALRLSDRTLVSYSGGGSLSFRVVNATTGQIVLSQSFNYALPDTAPTTLGASADGQLLASAMMDALDRSIVTAIMQSTFPLSVIQRDGRNVVINQSGQIVTQGATYRAVTLGKEAIDPQSGLSLGPTEAPCCTVMIDRVAQNLSYGHIVENNVDLSSPFVPGSMELREEVSSATRAPTVMHAAATRRPKSASTAGAATKEDSNW